MGCDGGTIPKRDELVRTKKKKEQVNNLQSSLNLEFDFITELVINYSSIFSLQGYLSRKEFDKSLNFFEESNENGLFC